MKKVLVALSGGVDSAVAALLLKKQGYDVAGAYMKNWINEDSISAHCPWQQDIEDARAVSETIGIGFEVVNFIREYRERVVKYLVDGYKRGLTPNPDVMCNREMKFGVFLDYALKQGFDAVATGHYCRSQQHPGRPAENALYEGVDKNKDQSYFLALISNDQLQKAIFPVGHLTKQAVRELAKQEGLPNAGKKDSQGICFIGEVKIGDFLENYIPDQPGEIINHRGELVGTHRGLHRYTLGQRKGIGVPSNTDNEHYVVVGKDLETNQLLVAFESAECDGLFQKKMHVHSISWLNEPLTEETTVLARPRYRDPSVKSRFIPTGDKSAWIIFEHEQRALASGQVCAFYDGERLLGGGVFS